MLSGVGPLPDSVGDGWYQGGGVLFAGRRAIACYNDKL